MDRDGRALNAGPVFVLLSAVCFSLGGLLIKYIPWNGLAINGMRSLIAVAVMLVFLRVKRHRLRVNRTVLIGALSVCATTVLYTLANKLTTAGNTIILQFTAPVFVMLFTALIFRKRPTRLDVTAAVFVFAGVFCFFVDSLSSGNTLGNALALLSGVTYAGVFMMNSAKDADALSSEIIGFLVNAAVGLPALFAEDLAAAPASAWTAVVLLGLVQVALGYILLAKGLETTPAVTASLLSGIEPVLNPVLVAVFYGEMLTPLSLLGAAVVFLSVLTYNVLSLKRDDNPA